MGKYLKSRKDKHNWPKYLMFGDTDGVAVEFNERYNDKDKALYYRIAGAWDAVVSRVNGKYYFEVLCPYGDCAYGKAFPCTQAEHDESNGIDRAYEMVQRIKRLHETKEIGESWDIVPF